ncbi:Small glutamine-rich tetratricopeptide repeat-containing protein 2 [Coemansia sp. RSA 1933]|nr:Small glutamine-rich tetratricopeptide repeat-containing protein 2 [Coemansia sp. RSA 1933]
MQTPEEIRQRLAVGIVEYLDKAVTDGHVTSDGAESLEIAKQCIADAFGINMEDQAGIQELSLKPLSLDKVFDVYLKTQAKVGSASSIFNTNDNQQPQEPSAAPATDSESEDDKERADAFKAEGNRLIMSKDFAGAIGAYSKAIELVRNNAVYFGNRSAAYSQNGDHEKAVADAKQALEIDASYSKGYSRLGHAYFGMGDFAAAADAYEKGLALDPENTVMKASLETTKAKLGSDGSSVESGSAARSSSTGAGGGGFDMSSLMNNPALMSMAQSMMASGGLDQLMSNPAISRLAENYRSTGQMPNMSDMMNNPELMNMARNFSGAASSSGERGSDTSSGGGAAAAANPLASLMNNPELMNMAQQFMRNNNGSNNSNGNSGD